MSPLFPPPVDSETRVGNVYKYASAHAPSARVSYGQAGPPRLLMFAVLNLIIDFPSRQSRPLPMHFLGLLIEMFENSKERSIIQNSQLHRCLFDAVRVASREMLALTMHFALTHILSRSTYQILLIGGKTFQRNQKIHFQPCWKCMHRYY